MENPATWTEAEWVVHDSVLMWREAQENGMLGLSLPMTVTNALRQAGLLADKEQPTRTSNDGQ